MSDEIINFLEEKISNPKNKIEKDLDQATLNLYKSGNINAKIQDGELLISITEKGESSFLKNFSYALNPAEA